MISCMTLSEFIADAARRRQLAADLGSSPAYLWQIATGRRSAGHKLARAIEKQTAGAVTKESLRPDVWSSSTN